MKPFWKSKTVLFNVIFGVVMFFLGMEEVQANADIIAIVGALGNIILRSITKEPITIK